ncbi:MAG: hypothetical protein U0670_01205 [Anaerolineae bacterium]
MSEWNGKAAREFLSAQGHSHRRTQIGHSEGAVSAADALQLDDFRVIHAPLEPLVTHGGNIQPGGIGQPERLQSETRRRRA